MSGKPTMAYVVVSDKEEAGQIAALLEANTMEASEDGHYTIGILVGEDYDELEEALEALIDLENVTEYWFE